jgi:hypothetical protein
MFGKSPRSRWHFGLPLALALVLALTTALVAAAATLVQISTDTFTNTTSQHKTEVEPDTFSSGSTIVSAFQMGRFTNGGASDLGFATSQNAGVTWTNGSLPGITVLNGGTFSRVSDPAVAFDPKHNVWMISGLAITVSGTSVNGAGISVSRSTDGGLTWPSVVVAASATGSQNFDKDWITCDGTPTSPFYGNCYVEWDDNGAGNLILMSTSTDGGLTWGPALKTGNSATGIGGQPVVLPSGTVAVPMANANETSMISFISTNGGASWGSTVTVSNVRAHRDAGNIRSGPLPSAAIDSSGKIYLVWEDCRFINRCTANDIVMSTSTNGTTWSAVTRIPIDSTTSKVDHFIPGIAADPATSAPSVHLAVTFYYYPSSSCSSSTCQLDVGFVSSADGGSTWTAKTQLAGPLTLSWLASTTQGRMVGDYMSTSYVSGKAVPVFASASAPVGSTFQEEMFAPAGGLSAPRGTSVATSEGAAALTAADAAAAATAPPATAR